MIPEITSQPDLSGIRFRVAYRLTGDETLPRAKADDICLEQTVEFPADVLPEGQIRRNIVGRIESFRSDGENHFQVVISYPVEAAGKELTQLLNVIFGNISIKPGIRVEWLDLPDEIVKIYRGPRFGRNGLRRQTGVSGRPLLCSALKPMGLSARDLAEMAYKFALNGLDIVKDDHGLADQHFAPFKERVKRCAEKILLANKKTGRNCLYLPNISAPADLILKRAKLARDAGAGGLMVAPGITGFDTMREIADCDSLVLPVFSHPALLGTFVTSPDQGISHPALFGQIMRLAGADAVIYPNFGGRFSFSRTECESIVKATASEMGPLKPIFPAPGGGMKLDRIEEWKEVYGIDVIYLVGGGLFKHGPDLSENCRYFREKWGYKK